MSDGPATLTCPRCDERAREEIPAIAGVIRWLAMAVAAAACAPATDAEPSLDGLPVWTLVEELRIGSMDDPDSLGFSSVSGLDLDDEGRLYVLDWHSRQVRVFDPDGRFLRRIGREGGGPGEFRNVSSLGVVGDTLWVREAAYQRLTLFRTDGALIGSIAAPEGATVSEDEALRVVAYPASLRAEGGFHALYAFPATFAMSQPAPEHLDSVRVRAVAFDDAGAAVETGQYLTLYPPRAVTLQGGQFPVTYPVNTFGVADHPLLVTDAGERIVVHRPATGDPGAARVTVTRVGPQGDVVYTKIYRVDAVPITRAMADSIIELGSGRVTATGWTREQFRTAIRRSLELPDYLPPVTLARRARDGSIWLRRESHDPDRFRWTVLDPDGEPGGEVHLSRRTTPHRIDRDHLWAVERDELDVPYVVRYRIEREG